MAVLLSTVLSLSAKAEGSRDMFPSGAPGNRGHIEWRSDFATGFRRRTLLYVFANQGEYILLGSSAVGVGQGDIEIFDPRRLSGQVANEVLPAAADLSCSAAQPGVGFITDRAQELAGPQSVDGSQNLAGYVPCYYQAPVTGVYAVAMYGPSGRSSARSPDDGIEHSIEAINTNANQNTSISAWDVTVRNSLSSTTDIKGRLHTFNMAFNMGQNQANLYADLYPVTVDGFRYRVELNGLDPFGFNIFGNQLGNLDSDGVTPLYHTVLGTDGALSNTVGGTTSASPQYPIFFNEIDASVLPFLPVYDPLSGLQTRTGFPADALLPQVVSPTYVGNLRGITSSVGGGGVFSFGSNLLSGNYELVISHDGVNYDPSHPNNKVIRGFMSAPGVQTVPWDGFDNSNQLFPSGTFSFTVLVKGGEYHFPISDVENNPFGGPIYNLLNATNPQGNTVGFYDHRGYYTIDGTLVADRDPDDGDPTDDALCGLNPPSPASSDLVTGSDSAAPGFNVFGVTNASGNTNVLCTGGFGDTKTLDLWTYFPSLPPLVNPLIVIEPTDFGDAPDSGAGNGPGNYSTLFGENGPRHVISPLPLFLGSGVSGDNNGFVDGVDDSGNATDDADDALLTVSVVAPGRVYALNNISVRNETGQAATLSAWIDFDGDGAFEASEYQRVEIDALQTTTSVSWEVPETATEGITYVRLRLTTDPLIDDALTVTVDERSLGEAVDGEVEDYRVEIRRAGPRVLLVKRITAIAGNRVANPNDGTPLNQFVDDTSGIQAAEDNHPDWPTGYLLGAMDGGEVRSAHVSAVPTEPAGEQAADSVEYTLYFLSVGSTAARGVLLCDRIPADTIFLPDAYTAGPPADPLVHPVGSFPRDLGLTLHFQGTDYALTAAADADAGYYFPPGLSPTTVFPNIGCDGPNQNGAVVVNVGDLSPATGPGTPLDAWGSIRFQVQVR